MPPRPARRKVIFEGLGGDQPPISQGDELTLHPVQSSFGALDFGGETNFHAGYREWLRLMSARRRGGDHA
jgi:hypothetical protein